ncbi:11618_t:CDS:2, partial [Funneliformis mosseae]
IMPETRANNYIKNTSYVPKNNKRTQQKNKTMETPSPKVINKVIENIILFTDNNNQTPSNTEKEDTTIFLT